MSCFEKEAELIGYRGIYCRLCDYFTGKIRNVARRALEMVEKHGELKIFAEKTGAFNYEELVRGLKWMATTLTPCIGGCRGDGGWEACPVRKCRIDRKVDFCFECSEFPCKILEESSPRAVDRLMEIKELGIENWIKRQLA